MGAGASAPVTLAQRAPVEGESQEQLRPVGESLHERVDRDKNQRGGAERHGEPVELDQDEKTGEALQRHDGPGPRYGALTARDRP